MVGGLSPPLSFFFPRPGEITEETGLDVLQVREGVEKTAHHAG